jgi:hypothetical protein
MLDSLKEHASSAYQWAASGTKLTYAAVGFGVIVGLILFRFFFRSPAGLFHSIGFSFGSGGNPAVAAEPGLASSSRLKLVLIVLLPAICGYAAYVLLPSVFPTVFGL